MPTDVLRSAAINFEAAPTIATVGAFGFNRFPPLGGTQANRFVAVTWFQLRIPAGTTYGPPMRRFRRVAGRVFV
jgi:hypothetical protein